MIGTLIGQKLDQAQDFLQNGKRVPVTEISVTENVVLQVKTAELDSYAALQLGVGTKKKPTKALLGHAKKAGVGIAPLKIREISVEGTTDEDMPKAGDLISVDGVFKPGDLVQVTGISKGKGFAGGVKRHGFRGGPKTHGQSDRHRAPGSIGQGTTPGRVYKGKRMAGRMGTETVTVKNLTVVNVDNEAKLLYVSGLVPGHKNSWVVITRIGEDKKFVPLLSAKEKEETKEPEETKVQVAADVDVSKEDAKQEKVEDASASSAQGKVEAKIEEQAEEVKTEEVVVEDSTKNSEEEVKVENKPEDTPVEEVKAGEPKEENA